MLSGDRLERPDVAEFRRRGIVPEQPVAAAGHDGRDVDDGVALPEIEIVALDIELAFLALAQTVQGLVRVGLPDLLDVMCRLALDLCRFDVAPAARFREDHAAVPIGERDDAVGADCRAELGGDQCYAAAGRLDRETWRGSGGRWLG